MCLLLEEPALETFIHTVDNKDVSCRKCTKEKEQNRIVCARWDNSVSKGMVKALPINPSLERDRKDRKQQENTQKHVLQIQRGISPPSLNPTITAYTGRRTVMRQTSKWSYKSFCISHRHLSSQCYCSSAHMSIRK